MFKTLKFRPELAALILAGQKTTTWRLFDDKNLQVGDNLLLLNKVTLQEFAKARITSIQEKTLGQLEDKDFEGHERYENDEDMIKHFR